MDLSLQTMIIYKLFMYCYTRSQAIKKVFHLLEFIF
jgi:hypothetical protein